MKSGETLIQSLMVIAVSCSVLATGMLGWSLFRHRTSTQPPPPAAPVEVKDWQKYATGGHLFGAREAPVTIVEWGDFECPYCADYAIKTLTAVLAKHPGKIALLFRHFPLPMHRLAYPAARAAECAGVQGKFREIHDQFFVHQDSLGILSFDDFARRAEVPDVDRFHECISSSATVAAIDEDIEAGKALGVTATPSLLVGGKLYAGALSVGVMDSIVDALLRSPR